MDYLFICVFILSWGVGILVAPIQYDFVPSSCRPEDSFGLKVFDWLVCAFIRLLNGLVIGAIMFFLLMIFIVLFFGDPTAW